MRLSARVALIALLAAAFGIGAASAFAGAAPTEVAAGNGRCTGLNAGILERQVRADDREVPGTTLNALNDRQQELDGLLQQAQLESDILHNACSDAQLTPLQNQLAGVIAWAYALEADIAPKRYTLLRCPQTAAQAPGALIASAWYALSTTLVPSDPAQPISHATPAPLVRTVMPMVQARAAAIHMTLPPPTDATEYWRNNELGKVSACPPPTP